MFVPAALEVVAEIKRTIYTAFCPLILRLELSHNAIENKVNYDLAITLTYISNKERKQIDRREVIGVANGEGGAGGLLFSKWNAPTIKRMTTKSIVHSIWVFFSIFVYSSN